jgi:diguanylate cyclase (GGDEF)-like protein
MLLLPRTNRSNAIRVAEKLRQRIEHLPLAEDIPVRVSIGVATASDDGETAEALLATVDQAMYRVKQGGSGRVAFSS